LCPTKTDGFSSAHRKKQYKKGDFVFFPNDPSDKIYFLRSGKVKIGSYLSNGREIIKALLNPGEIFGELALFKTTNKRSDFALALDNVEVCIMGIDDMKNLMKDDQDFGLQITMILGNKLVKTERRMESLLFKDARTRIVEYIKELAEEKGQRVGYEALIRDFFLTHQDIANLTGTSRQTVTTVLNELRDENLIYFDRKRLLIRDLTKLA
jgi:CRP-like cAMP-binding protein